MHFKVKPNIFLKALTVVNGVVEKKNTIPVLQNIKIQASSNNIFLCASDMDLYATSNVNCEVIQEGCTTIPAQMLFDIIRKINDQDDIEIKLENNNININCQNSKYNLPCINASEFPDIDNNEYDHNIEVDAEKFAKMIDKTRFAISNDETRYYLNGLYFHSRKINDKLEICCVATDGHRLALSNINHDQDLAEFGIIIPKKSVNEIRRIIDFGNKIKIEFSRVKIKISSQQNTITSKLIDGQFPNYNKILPQNNSKKAQINRKDFYSCIDRVSSVANDKHKSIKVTIENNKMDLEVTTNDGSFAHEFLEIKYDDDKIVIGFNSRYLMDIISQIDNEVLTMKFDSNMSPTLIETDNVNYQFVIMPIRVN